MKTILQHFEKLPEPYRTQAIENTKFRRLNLPVENIKEAICCAFEWGRSPQKWDYWDNFTFTTIININ